MNKGPKNFRDIIYKSETIKNFVLLIPMRLNKGVSHSIKSLMILKMQCSKDQERGRLFTLVSLMMFLTQKKKNKIAVVQVFHHKELIPDLS